MSDSKMYLSMPYALDISSLSGRVYSQLLADDKIGGGGTLPDSNVIYVSPTVTSGIEFTTIKSALLSITNSSMINPYVVILEPGVYREYPFTIPQYTSIISYTPQSTQIIPNMSDSNFITFGDHTSIANVTLSGPFGQGYFTFVADGVTCEIEKVKFSSDIFQILSQTSTSSDSYVTISNCSINPNSKITRGFEVSCGANNYSNLSVLDSDFSLLYNDVHDFFICRGERTNVNINGVNISQSIPQGTQDGLSKYVYQEITVSDSIGVGHFGRESVISADGLTMSVAGTNDSNKLGGIWIFTRQTLLDEWVQAQKLSIYGAVGTAIYFGYTQLALSADGSTLSFGGKGDSGNIGAVWIFVKTNGTWIQEQKVIGSGYSGINNIYQGTGVALSSDGNVLAFGGDGDAGGIGATWVFTRSNGVWTQLGSKIVGSHVGVSDQGFQVQLSDDGNTLAIGGSQDDSYTGAVWIYTRSGNSMTFQAKLIGGGSIGNAAQGFSLSLSGDGNVLISGGESDDSSNGAFWVFTRSGSTWDSGVKVSGSNNFGHYVCVNKSGDTFYSTSLTYGNKGKVSKYKMINGSITFVTDIQPEGLANGSNFGYTISLDETSTALFIGTTVEIGYAYYLPNSNSNGFSVYDGAVCDLDNSIIKNFNSGVSLPLNGNSAILYSTGLSVINSDVSVSILNSSSSGSIKGAILEGVIVNNSPVEFPNYFSSLTAGTMTATTVAATTGNITNLLSQSLLLSSYGNIKFLRATLTQANILAMHDNPISLVSAISGYIIYPLNAIITMKTTGNNYTNGGDLMLQLDSTIITSFADSAVIKAKVLPYNSVSFAITNNLLFNMSSTPLYVTNRSGPFGGTGNSATVCVFYVIIPNPDI
jgi:hypothetical protein